LSEIESGIYFVKIEYGKNINTQKIIIKKWKSKSSSIIRCS
jgi:hypothetical protein